MTLSELTDLMNRFVADNGWYRSDSRAPHQPVELPDELGAVSGSRCLF